VNSPKVLYQLLRHACEELRELSVGIGADYSAEHIAVDRMLFPSLVSGQSSEDGPESVSMRPQLVRDGFFGIFSQGVESGVEETECNSVARVPLAT
jgi:hypothetical protein